MRRIFALSSTLVAIFGMLVATVVVGAAPTSQGGTTLRVYAGDGEGVVTMNDFRAPFVRVAQGTTVTWVTMSDEPHTVTFLAGRPRPDIIVPQPEDPAGRPPMANPDVFFPVPPTGPWEGTTYINSAFLERSQEFSVNFARPGRYDYVCMLHPPMTGTVEVVAAGSPGITTQAEVDADHASRTAAHVPQVANMYDTRSGPSTQPGPSGTTVHIARAGTETRNDVVELNAFFPSTLTIRQGDTVVWYNDNPATPHTVTFPAEGQEPPDFFVPTLPDGTVLTGPPPGPPPGAPAGPPDPSMMPRLVLGPGAAPIRPGPGASYDGRGLFNSGLMGDLVNPMLGSSWALTFDAPGVFRYLCIVHPGMEGMVVVEAR